MSLIGAGLASESVEPGSVQAARDASEAATRLFCLSGGIGLPTGAAWPAAEAASDQSGVQSRRNTKLFTAGKGGENVCGRRCLPSSEIPGSGKVRAPPFAREFTDALALGARFPKRSAGAFHSFPDGFKEGARSRQMHPSWSGQVGSEAFPGSVR